MSQLSARIVGDNKSGMTMEELMGFSVDCTGVFDSKHDKVNIGVDGLEVAEVACPTV